MRHIPATMATQHPDNACAPYWETDGDGFVSTTEEVEECFSSFHDLDCEEYMWDWEGKYVEEAVIERLFQEHHAYFKRHPLGKEKFLTFRIPNIWQERSNGLARAMMCMLTAENMARHLGLHAPPLFEVILPMTKKAGEIIHIQKIFSQLSRFTSKLFQYRSTLPEINVMPLFEGIDDLLGSRAIVGRYIEMYKRAYHKRLEYLRVHIARSDPALNAGLVPAVVAGKIALSEFYYLSEESGLPVYPEIGVGTLPFRGGLGPTSVSDWLKQYGGIRTVYIQSAFRYDFPLNQVKTAIKKLNQELPRAKPQLYATRQERRAAEEICRLFSTEYRRTVERLAPTINHLAMQVPRRRERKQHIGLFGYSRGLGKKRLPRAIPFTAVFYSLGIPPEFLGTGFALQKLQSTGLPLEHFYPNFQRDLKWAARFVNKHNLAKLAEKSALWRRVAEDVRLTERFLGCEAGPREDHDFAHRELTTQVYNNWLKQKPLGPEIIASGKIRQSLG